MTTTHSINDDLLTVAVEFTLGEINIYSIRSRNSKEYREGSGVMGSFHGLLVTVSLISVDRGQSSDTSLYFSWSLASGRTNEG